MTEKINYSLSLVYINLFILFYLIRTDLNKLFFFFTFLSLISIFFLLYEIKKKKCFNNFFDFNKNEKHIIFIIFLLVLTYSINFDAHSEYSLINKASCKSNLIFLSYDFGPLKRFICKFYLNFYLVFFLLVFLILRKILREINISKILILSSIFFSILAIINTIIYFVINELTFKHPDNLELLNYFRTFTEYNNTGLYAYFQLLPIGASGYRNVEVFTILPGYFASFYLVIKNINKNKLKIFFINNFLFIILFLTYSRAAWVTIAIIEVSTIFYFYLQKNLIYKKIIFQNLIKLFLLFITIVLLTIYLNSNSLKKNFNNRNHLGYYTLFKISSLTPFTNLQNYFNLKNYKAWNHWRKINSQVIINDDITNADQVELYRILDFENNIKEKMNEHLNSNLSRKQIYLQSINKIKEKPFFGHGLSNFEFKIFMESTKEVKISRGNAESQINQIVLEKGIFGLLLFLTFFYKLFNTNKIISLENTILSAILIYSLFVTLQFYFFYWVLLACCSVLKFSKN